MPSVSSAQQIWLTLSEVWQGEWPFSRVECIDPGWEKVPFFYFYTVYQRGVGPCGDGQMESKVKAQGKLEV